MAALAQHEDMRGPGARLAMLMHPARRSSRVAAAGGVETQIRAGRSSIVLRAPRTVVDASPFPVKPSALNAY